MYNKANKDKPVIGVLLGDSAGIGPEIVAKAAAKGVMNSGCNPVIIGDLRVLKAGMKIAGTDFHYTVIGNLHDADWSKGIPVLDQKNQNPDNIKLGEVNPYCGNAVGEMIKTAIALFKEGMIDGFCYAPFNKAALRLGGFNFESEHDIFTQCFNWTEISGEMNVVDKLWTSRVTSHIPIKDVSSKLTVKSILEAIQLADRTVKRTGIKNPRIAVAALNPHSGENGLCGREEIDVIFPAVEEALRSGINALGVYPSDAVFRKAFSGEFDVVVTMYHDQGQIALKLNEFEHAITVAAGLPAPITTPAHGTAFDIAGRGIAKTSAFEDALDTVIRMARYDNEKRDNKL